MLPGFFAHLLLFVVMTSSCLLGRPLEVPPQPCGTVREYHFLQPVWSQVKDPVRAGGVTFRGLGAQLSSCDLLEGIKAGAAAFAKRRGHGRHTAYDLCPVTYLQDWGHYVPN